MGTAGPARPSPTRDAGWWPKCRAGPTGNTFPKMTFTLTWPRAVAPVRRGRLPTPSCRRESGRMAPVVSTDCRLSSSTGRYVGYVHCGSQCIAAQGRPGRRVLIHPQEALLQQARALQQSADYDEYRARRVVVEHRLARLVQLGIRQARYFGRVKTKFQLYLHGGQSHPGGGQNRAVGQYRWRRSRPPRRPNDVRAVSPMRRPISARSGSDNYVPDFVRLGFTAATPLPNQGFPARFLVA